MYGRHLLNSWSTTQNAEALSSGEAEYYGLVKERAQAIGFKKMMEELGVKSWGQVENRCLSSDIEVSQLWFQGKVAKSEINVEKTDGVKNVAGQLARYMTKENIRFHVEKTSQVIKDRNT